MSETFNPIGEGEEGFSALFEQEKRPPCQLYLISPPTFTQAEHVEALKAAFGAGGVAAYQLRLKNVSDAEILEAARVLQPICAEHDVAFVMNDRADLAKACGADVVHLGQSDGSVKEARELLGDQVQIGVTCNASRHLAMEAGEQGANYVAFGAFYPTSTKEVEHMADPSIISWWVALSPIPCVAIGGITPENCRPLVEAGADFLAVSAAVWNEDPALAVQKFAKAMARG